MISTRRQEIEVCATTNNNFTRNCCKGRHRDYPDEDYDSLATTHAFLRDAAAETSMTKTTTHSSPRLRLPGTPVSLATAPSLAWYGAPKSDIRECCYPGKRTRPDTTMRKPIFRRTHQSEKAVSVPQTFHFLNPAASVSGRVFRRWWNWRRRTTGNLKDSSHEA